MAEDRARQILNGAHFQNDVLIGLAVAEIDKQLANPVRSELVQARAIGETDDDRPRG